jgi:sister chromatid cohesion protein DCC1
MLAICKEKHSIAKAVEWSVDNDDGHQYELLELNHPQLLEAVRSKDGLAFKGRPDEPLTLCTGTQTFAVQELCVSNAMVICASNDPTCLRAVSRRRRILEPRLLAAPDHSLLAKILDDSLIVDDEEGVDGKVSTLYSIEELKTMCPCSDAELESYLRSNGAILFQGRVRKPSGRLLGRFFEVLMMTAALQGVEELSGLPRESLLMLLVESEEFNAELSALLLAPFLTDESKLDGRRVCRLYAKQLLMARNNLPLDEFMQLWEMVCGDLRPDVAMLPGLALIETPSMPSQDATISLFDADDLPRQVEERFQRLFTRRPKWRLEELRPYLLEDGDKTIVAYCRLSTDPVDNVKYATSRIAILPY